MVMDALVGIALLFGVCIIFATWMAGAYFVLRIPLIWCSDFELPAPAWVLGWGVYLGGMFAALVSGILAICFAMHWLTGGA